MSEHKKHKNEQISAIIEVVPAFIAGREEHLQTLVTIDHVRVKVKISLKSSRKWALFIGENILQITPQVKKHFHAFNLFFTHKPILIQASEGPEYPKGAEDCDPYFPT